MIKRICKLFILILTLVSASVMLGACGEDKTHTVVFYHTMGDSLQSVLAVAKQQFEEKFPGWKVEDTAVGGYDDVRKAVIADLQGRTQPDLVYCYPDHVAKYITTKKVVDMSVFMNSTEQIEYTKVEYQVDASGEFVLDKEGNKIVQSTSLATEVIGYTADEIADFVPGYYAEGLATNYANASVYGYSDTAMLTLPFVKSTELLYYNATALKACGIVDEDGNAKAPETWDELWADCEIITKTYPNCVPLGYDSEANWFITMCEQNGWGYTSTTGNLYNFNNDNTKAWLADLNAKYKAGYITTQEEYGAYTSNLFVKGAEEGIVFSIGSSGGASHQKPADGTFDWAVAPVPGTKVGNTVVRKAISQGPSLCMFQSELENADEKAKMTWEFVKLLLDPTFQASFSIASGYNPARESAYEIDQYVKHLDSDNITAVAASVAKTMVNDFFTSPAFDGSSIAREQVGNALVYALTGEKSPADALADALKNCGGNAQ